MHVSDHMWSRALQRNVPVTRLGIAAATVLGLVPSLVVSGSHSSVASADQSDNGDSSDESSDGNGDRSALLALGRAYKQLNADVGVFGLATLKVSAAAIQSNTPGDATYDDLIGKVASLGSQRDALARQISDVLTSTGSDHHGDRDSIRQLTAQANDLLSQASELAADS